MSLRWSDMELVEARSAKLAYKYVLPVLHLLPVFSLFAALVQAPLIDFKARLGQLCVGQCCSCL